MSNFTVGSIFFDGFRGTIQLAKPTFESFTRTGGSQQYIQYIKTEAKVSTITVWSVLGSWGECETKVNNIISILGLKQSITVKANSETIYYNDSYVLDYDHTIKCKAGNQFMLEMILQIKIDVGEVL